MDTSPAVAPSALAPAPVAGVKRVRSLFEQLQDEESRIQRLEAFLGMDVDALSDAPGALINPTLGSTAEAAASKEQMEVEERRAEELLEVSAGAAATSEPATVTATKSETAAVGAAAAPPAADSIDSSTNTLTMMVLDMHEAADHSMHIYGVRPGGGSALLRVSGFRNFFYLELREPAAHPAAAPADAPLAGAGVAAAEAAAADDDDRVAAMVFDVLAADGQLKLGWSAAAEQLTVRAVRRMPLLACYQHVAGAAGAGQPAALPTSAAALSVRMLRVEFAPSLKPKGLLEALSRAIQSSADAPLRRHLKLDEHQQIVSYESQMAPAGTSALARRFALEKDLAGGAWLTASNVAPPPQPLGSCCQQELACAHDDLAGHAPDIITAAANADERWTRLPRLSTLAVRVVSTLGHSEPQWEAGEGTSATVDGVRLIACESSTTDGGPPSLLVMAVALSASVAMLPAADGVCGGQPIELRTFPSEGELLLGFERHVADADPDLLLTYDARCLGLVSTRHAELMLGLAAGSKLPKPTASKPAANKGKAKAGGAAGGGAPTPLQLGRQRGEAIKVVPIVTYGKQWQAKGGRQQMSENLETTEVVGLTGRFSCDLLRAMVSHQSHKLTTYTFAQAVEAVLGEPTELMLPEVLASAPTERAARHAAQQCQQLSALCRRLKTVEETVEMARLTGLPLRTITNQAQMVRTENLLLKAARTLAYVLPLNTVPVHLRWSSAMMPSDGRAFQHWPWPMAELDREQKWCIDIGVAAHCSRTAAQADGSAGLHADPVVVLDYASLYPSCFIANNICYSTLLPAGAHEAGAIASFHATPGTVGPNSRRPGVSKAFDLYPWEASAEGGNEVRRWPGSAIAFAPSSTHAGLMPRLLQRLLSERRAVKARIKELLAQEAAAAANAAAAGAPSAPGAPSAAAEAGHSDLCAVLEARQLTLKLLANASYGFTGADTSHLCCKPLAEACLRFGNYYCKRASELLESEGRGHEPSATSPTPRWAGAHAIYANTDSVFVELPGRSAAEAVEIGRQMAAFVSQHPSLPTALTLEYERVLMPCLLDGHNRYAGAEWVRGTEARPALHQKGLLERTQCGYVQSTLLQAMRELLLDNSLEDALASVLAASKRLLGGKAPVSELVEGGFVKRANQRDLIRMAGLVGKDGAERVDKATREQDASLARQNSYACAIELLRASASASGQPTRVFRLGEYVPFVLASRSGGALGSKQFENVAIADDVVLRRTPVSLRLLYTNRLLPALFGQFHERTGTTTKAAAAADKPALLGRLLPAERVASLRAEAARVSCDGVLTCAEAWRLYGLAAPPKEARAATGAQKGQTSLGAFFGAKPSTPAHPPSVSPTDAPSATCAPSVGDDGAASAAATPARGKDKAAEAASLEAERKQLVEQRAAIARASGRLDDDEPLLLHNFAAQLANVERQLAALRR